MTEPLAGRPSGARWAALGLVLVLVATAAIRGRLLDVPLERDEAEYAVTASLLLDGFSPYEASYDLKMPGLHVVYAGVIAAFGSEARGIHLGLLLAHLLSVVLIFLLVGRWIGPAAALSAAAFQGLLPLGRGVLGFTANAEHFLVVPALAGLVLLLRAEEKASVRLLGGAALLLGTSFVIKQPGILFVMAGAAWIVGAWARRAPRDFGRLARLLIVYGGCAAVPLVLLAAWIAAAGVLDHFLFWSFEYAIRYAGTIPLGTAAEILEVQAMRLFRDAPAVWILAALGVAALAGGLEARRHRGFIAVFAGFSVLSVAAGGFFREHYFVLMLPAVSLMAALGVEVLRRGATKRFGSAAGAAMAGLLVAVAVGSSAYSQRGYLFEMTPDEIVRAAYLANPFLESREVGSWIREHSEPDDRILVLGSEPQIYLYANRRSVSKHVVMYPLMLAPPELGERLQRELIDEIETGRPRYVVFAKLAPSWLAQPSSARRLFQWTEEYLPRHYDLVGLVELHYPQPSLIVWGERARRLDSESDGRLLILERRDEAG